MKKVLFAALLLIAGSGLAFRVVRRPPDYKKAGAPMPPFRILQMDSAAFYDRSLKPGMPTVVMIFSPQCDHCEKVIDTLKQQAARFAGAQFVFVAEATQRPHMQAFIKRTGIGKVPLFKIIGTDWSNLIYYTYRQEVLPQVNVYDKDRKLKHTFLSRIPLDSVAMMIR